MRTKTEAADDLLISSESGAPAPDGRGHLSTATDNSTMMAHIMDLYARPGMTVVDPMMGPGVFWKKIDTDQYNFFGTDITTSGPDARNLPHDDSSVHVMVLDPPYRYMPMTSTSGGLRMRSNDIYNLESVRQTGRFQDVMDLYSDSMKEAYRVLRRGGYLVLKCQDTVAENKQRWVHVELMQEAESLGFGVIDLAVITPTQVPPTRWKIQRSLRKSHSYFLVMRKGGRWPFGYKSVSAR